MGTLLITGLGILAAGDETVFRERSFFGVSQVRVYPTERLTLLLSGTTKHGAQSLEPARRQEPLSYYYRTGPIGQVFAALPAQDIPRVAIIGLGLARSPVTACPDNGSRSTRSIRPLCGSRVTHAISHSSSYVHPRFA
jgi:hypothetical protein